MLYLDHRVRLTEHLQPGMRPLPPPFHQIRPGQLLMLRLWGWRARNRVALERERLRGAWGRLVEAEVP